MKPLRQLLTERAQLSDKIEGVRAAARDNLAAGRAEGGDPVAATKKHETLKAELASLDAEAQLLDQSIADGKARQDAERTAPAARTGSAISVREGWESDPKRGFATSRDFFVAVQHAGRGRVAPNLESLRTPTLATAGSDEQSAGSDAYGGFHIPKTLLPGTLSIGPEGDFAAGLTRKIPMATPEVFLNARVDKDHSSSVSGGLIVYRRAEAGTVTAKRTQFEQVHLRADALMGLAYATEEVLRDSPESFAAILESGYRDEFAARKVKERLNGTGAGEFLGVNNAPGKIDVSKETGQAAATIVRANILKMRARCWGYANAIWHANYDCLPQLMEITLPGSTVPMFSQDAQGVDRLYGRPVIFTEFAETCGTVGDIELVNWGEYLEGEYEPIQGASSMHVRFVEHEQAFKFWCRNAGAPWWRTVLTPNKGATLAPIVRLATRS